LSADKSERPERRSEPVSLRLQQIVPSLTVGDIEASLAWYRDILGFHIREKWEHDGKVMGASLVAGTAHLMLGQDDWAKGRDRAKGEGFRLYLNTSRSVDELAAGIESRGGTLDAQPEDMPWGARIFSIVDPDGFKITFSTAT
jgi:uncharacterized glyoxalase superfamily protein PhnB